MKKTIPILILCAVLLAGCHIAADKSEVSELGPGSTWTRVEGVALDSATVAIVTGKDPPAKPSGWITRIDHMEAGESDKGSIKSDVQHSFGMDGIQTPLTRTPAVDAVTKRGERTTSITAKGIQTKQEEMKGLGVAELFWWIVGSLAGIGLILGAVYYYVPAARPIISGLIAKLPGFGKSEDNVKAKVAKETTEPTTKEQP